MITMGFEPMTSLARTQPLLKQRGERPAHLPDPLCAWPAPARPTHAMSSASAMHVHVHIPQDRPSSRVHVHLCLPDSKLEPPPSGATFGEDYVHLCHADEEDCHADGQLEDPIRGLVRGNKKRPVRGKRTDKKEVADNKKVADGRIRGPVGGKKNVTQAARRRVGGNGKAAGKKKAGP